VSEFHLQGVEEALHWCIVIAAAFSAHRRHRSYRGELREVGFGGVLAAAVAVLEQTFWRTLALYRALSRCLMARRV
jgi:hypothetical protein